MSEYGYLKTFTTKVIRTTHKVTIGERCTADSVANWIGKVPKSAVITDIFPNEDTSSIEITFEQEDTDHA